ncbi:Uncharacterized protein FKW44_021211, partial [Caligus rogercresseyi]
HSLANYKFLLIAYLFGALQGCGRLYSDTLHAFVDCQAVSILKKFVSLNVRGLI